MSTNTSHPRTHPDISNGRTDVPGPRGHWLLGNYPDFGDDALAFLLSLNRRYGPVSRTRFLIWDAYFATHPDAVQHILQSNHRNYSKQFIEYKKLSWVIGNGLITSDGEFWLRQRRLAAPAFHRKRIDAFAMMMRDATQQMLDRWAQHPADRPLDISKEMMRLTLEIVSQALFSFDSADDARTVDEAFSLVNEYIGVDAAKPFAPIWRHVPTPRNRAFKSAIAALDGIVQRIIDERRARPALLENGDLLSMLMTARDEESGAGMTDRQLRDEVITLLLAGHETTANALTWAFYLLSQHPAERRRLHAEVHGVLGNRPITLDDLPNLPYTRQVIDETLRLYPPAYSIGRVAIADDVIMGYAIPAGAPVFMSSYVTHRHPDFWHEPDRFDPDRFTPERSADRHRYAYFPFGGGPRICIGLNFALMEAQLILATIAQKWRLHLQPGHVVEPEPLITLRPRYGMQMRLESRQPAPTA